jgi:hypothetical protein
MPRFLKMSFLDLIVKRRDKMNVKEIVRMGILGNWNRFIINCGE